jgi:hypothetical protein
MVRAVRWSPAASGAVLEQGGRRGELTGYLDLAELRAGPLKFQEPFCVVADVGDRPTTRHP